MTSGDRDTSHVFAPPTVIFGGALLVGLLVDRVRRCPVPHGQLARPAGVALMGVGAFIAIRAQLAMRRARTSSLPYRPTTALVDDGPFRYSRNPMYVVFTLLYVGSALLANALSPLVILPAVLAVIVRGVVDREERYLAHRFRDQYRRYAARVHRWL